MDIDPALPSRARPFTDEARTDEARTDEARTDETRAEAARARGERSARSARNPAVRTSAGDREQLVQGRRAFERGDDDGALAHLRRVVESGLRFADVHYLIGLIHERRDDLPAARTSLEQALRINPGYVEALVALASVCERQGDYDRAAIHAERAAERARADADGLDATTRGKLANQQADLADALAAAGLRREAIDHYRQALERCPTFHDIRHRLAVSLREAGLGFQALREFERILDAEPGRLESRIQQGLTHYAMGDPREATAIWRAVIASDPTRREAQMYLRLIEDRPSASAAAQTAVATPTTRESMASDETKGGERAWSTLPLARLRSDLDAETGAADE